MIELLWQTNIHACALYATAVVTDARRPADERLVDALAAPAASMVDAFGQFTESWEEFQRAAVPMCRRVGDVATLVTMARRAAAPGDVHGANEAALAARLEAVEAALLRVHPDAPDQLGLRVGPLRSAWNARGPGLWKSLWKAFGTPDKAAQSSTAHVYCVMPVLGGGGKAFPADANGDAAVAIEGVLANPHFALPEVVRLAWLLARLFCCQNAGRCRHPTQLIPAVLKAAEKVELARFDRATLRLALDAWHVSGNTAELDDLADKLWHHSQT